MFCASIVNTVLHSFGCNNLCVGEGKIFFLRYTHFMVFYLPKKFFLCFQIPNSEQIGKIKQVNNKQTKPKIFDLCLMFVPAITSTVFVGTCSDNTIFANCLSQMYSQKLRCTSWMNAQLP